MKKFTSLLMLLFSAVAVMAQTTPAHNPGAMPAKATRTLQYTPKHFTKSPARTAGQRAVTPFAIAVDFDSSESYHTYDELGGTYINYAWRVNHNFPNDSLHDLDLTWAVERYDTLVDFTTNQGYSLNNTPVTVDSMDLVYAYERQSATNVVDTLIIRLFQTTAGSPLTLTPNTVNGFPSNTVLWSDTLFLNDSAATPSGFYGLTTIYPAFSVPTGQHFAIGVDFLGDTTNYFQISAGGGDTCNNDCIVFGSNFKDNAQYRTFSYYQGQDQGWSTPRSNVYFDCNQNSTADGCEKWYIQNYRFVTYMTIAPPLSVSPSATATNVCPGASNVTLTANAIGGNAPYTYVWSGPGLQSPYTDMTGLAIPSSNLTGTLTYSLTVTDANGDSTVGSVNLTLKGIAVNAGNDTTIACGGNGLDLTAALSGSLSGASVNWTSSTGASFSGNVFAGRGAGTYYAVATNAAGCIGRDTVRISLPTSQNVSFVLNTLYNGTHDTTTFSPCVSVVSNFTNTSSNQSGWSWSWLEKNNGTTGSTTNFTTTFNAVGVDSVTLTGDSSGCAISSVHAISVLPATNVNCDTAVGIGGLNLAHAVSVYPNPTAGVFNINFDGVNSNNVNITVYDIVGKAVATQSTFTVNGNDTKSIDLSKNANGIYFVRIQVDGKPYTTRITLNK